MELEAITEAITTEAITTEAVAVEAAETVAAEASEVATSGRGEGNMNKVVNNVRSADT